MFLEFSQEIVFNSGDKVLSSQTLYSVLINNLVCVSIFIDLSIGSFTGVSINVHIVKDVLWIAYLLLFNYLFKNVNLLVTSILYIDVAIHTFIDVKKRTYIKNNNK